MARSLIASAFGPDATLYDALDADRGSSQADLKKAFRRRALQFHPDRHIGRAVSSSSSPTTEDVVGDGGGPAASEDERKKRIEEVTLKFQAVSAAYEILMDPGRRSQYDATGRMGGSEDEDSYADGDGDNNDNDNDAARFRRASGSRSGSAKANQRRWEEFFRSVFDEVAGAGAKYGKADAFRGSKEEADEVLRHYRMCKGNMGRVVDCVIHGESGDKERWMRRIIEPAIRRGEVEDYRDGMRVARSRTKPSVFAEGALVDSDDDDDRNKKKSGRRTRLTKSKRLGKRKRLNETSNNLIRKSEDKGLVDTDDDDEMGDHKRPSSLARSKQTASGDQPAAMSKKDKLAYRVAKKRKQRAEREIELTEIMQSKRWSGAGGAGVAAAAASKRNARSGTFSDSLLSSLERKYSSTSVGKKRKR